mgnify:CR=1 FL=1
MSDNRGDGGRRDRDGGSGRAGRGGAGGTGNRRPPKGARRDGVKSFRRRDEDSRENRSGDRKQSARQQESRVQGKHSRGTRARDARGRNHQGRDDHRGSGPRRFRTDEERDMGQERAPRKSDLERRDPPLPEGMEDAQLPRGVRAELRGVPKDLADRIGARIIAAGLLIDEDPALALEHVLVARRHAARLAVVREAVAETAYAAGEWATALSEYRTLRRMRGAAEYLPVIADCERALGRTREALETVQDPEATSLDPDVRVELKMVEAGIRADMGQVAEAQRVLRQTISNRNLDGAATQLTRARVRYAYADLLAEHGAPTAGEWFAAAAKLDVHHETDAADRVDGTAVVSYDQGEDDHREDDHRADDHREDGDIEVNGQEHPHG